MQLDRRKTEILGDDGILDLARLIHSESLDALREVRGRGDGTSAPEGLELDVCNLACVVHPDSQLHDVSARWCAHETDANVSIAFRQCSHITWIVVVVEDFFVVRAQLWSVDDGDEWPSQCASK